MGQIDCTSTEPYGTCYWPDWMGSSVPSCHWTFMHVTDDAEDMMDIEAKPPLEPIADIMNSLMQQCLLCHPQFRSKQVMQLRLFPTFPITLHKTYR